MRVNDNNNGENDNKLLLSAMWEALNCSAEEDINADKVLEQYAEFRDNQEIDELKEKFLEEFGAQGSIIATRPARAIAFNGGSNPENPDNYFPGMHYSLPLVSYTMRLALGNNPEDAYEKYIQGVDRIAEKSGIKVDKYPTRERLERLCEPYLKKLRSIDIYENGDYLYNDGIDQIPDNNIARLGND